MATVKIDVFDGQERAVFLIEPNAVYLIKDGMENLWPGSVTWNSTTIVISGNRPISWSDATATSDNPLP